MSSKQSNFFSVRTETNRNPICFGCFSVCFAKPKNIFFGLFWFVGVSDRYQNNRNKHNFVKTNRKISKKTFYIRGVLETVNFFSRFKPKQTENQSVSVVFPFFFAKPNNFFFGLFRCFGPLSKPLSKQPKQTELKGSVQRKLRWV